ncbi:MAG: hypothetical protein ACYCPW_03755 [Nitrososphaerales archaeon]
MATETDRPIIYTKTYWITAGIGIAAVAIQLYYFARLSANVWWFDVTIFIGCLIADLVTLIYDRISKLSNKQYWIAYKFIGFALAIEFGATIGEELSSRIPVLFNGYNSTFVTFWALNIIVPTLLFIDFFLRSKFRVINTGNTSKQKNAQA